ncbi:MAG TPA: ATP-binding protein [Candidatus Acidoferrales bacterium]|nr:ATP-binding protein [Candidatus Acidoferrales bacterium]
MWSIEFVAVIIAIIGNISLSLFTLIKNPKSATNRLFFSFAALIALYITCNYILTHQTTSADTFFWVKIVMAIAPFINISFFLLVATFPKTKFTIKPYIFWLSFFSALIFIPLSQLNLIFTSAPTIGAGAGTPGSAMPFFLLQTLLFLGGGFVVLIMKYRKAHSIEKIQLRLFLFGAIVMFAAILLINLFLIIILHNSSLIGYLPLYTLVFIGFITYAIVRHRFLDIRLIVARTVAYFVLLFFIVATFTAWLFITSNLFFKNTISTAQTVVFIVIMLVIAFLIDPVKALLETFTDKIFFKGKYSSNELVFNLTQIMASTLMLSDLTKITLNRLMNTMRITRGAFILFSDDKKLHVADPVHAENIHINTDAIRKLFELHRVAIFDEEEDEKIKQMMRDLNILVAVPLHEDDHDEGLLVLGEKKSGEIYSQQDIEVLEIFGPEVSVALHNAESYEEISKFNITLKEEVERATKDLKTANEKLKALDKLKNEFVSVASHELRTPMTAIKSYLWMALNGKGGKLNEKQQYYVERGYNSVDRLIRLVNDMLNISRIESGRITIELQSQDINKLAQEVVDEVLPRANELDITVVLQKNESLPPVLADSDKIKEVLLNLTGNSLKFTPKGGTITVSFKEADGFVETRVTDNGAGIAPEDIGKLFQKFGLLPGSYITNQTSTSMGTGLGLFICRSIIDLHHGEIKAASDGKGKGSTFSFTLKEFKDSDVKELKTEVSEDAKEKVDLIHAQV